MRMRLVVQMLPALLATSEELAQTWVAPGAGAPAAGDVIAMVGDWDRGPVLAALAQRDLVVEWI